MIFLTGPIDKLTSVKHFGKPLQTLHGVTSNFQSRIPEVLGYQSLLAQHRGHDQKHHG
jgi:hypothetical protein